MAVGRPPSMGIDETTAVVHKKLAEVSSEAMLELHKRNGSMHLKIIGMERSIKDLHSQNKILLQESLAIKAMHESDQHQKQRKSSKFPRRLWRGTSC